MKVNTNSNVYIIIYSVVMVVIVAVLLSLAALGLKERQDNNILNEKKTQIVMALGYNADSVSYKDLGIKAYLLDSLGKAMDASEDDVFKAMKDVKATRKNMQFPLFVATDGSVVAPLYGAGLWGPIWGYIALAPDMNTVKGIVLDHKGETPGLGAEITTAKHQNMYKNKTIFEGEELVGITLKKGGAAEGAQHEVDAITGGTKTSDGVSAMIKDCLDSYKPYFVAVKAQAAPVEETTVVPAEETTTAPAEAAEEKSNDLNTENNGK